MQLLEGEYCESESSVCSNHSNKNDIRNREYLWKIKSRVEKVWFYVGKNIDVFLPIDSILQLRQTCRYYRKHLYHISDSTIIFQSLRGYSPDVILKQVLPVICSSIPSHCKARLNVDFSSCTLINDQFLIEFAKNTAGNSQDNALGIQINSINLDQCYRVTERGFEYLLSSNYPHLHSLSFKNLRNSHLNGRSFIDQFSIKKWPNIRSIDASFSSVSLEAFNHIAKTLKSGDHSSNSSINIIGTMSSRRFLENIGMANLVATFTEAIINNDVENASTPTKAIRKNMRDVEKKEYQDLIEYYKEKGSELLVNIPIQLEFPSGSQRDCKEIWTLPLSYAINHDFTAVFDLLLKRGAEPNGWDHLQMSPLFHCVVARKPRLAEVIIEQGGVCLCDVTSKRCLTHAIENNDLEMLKLVIKTCYYINSECPAISGYFTPLYTAVDCESSESVEYLLKYGCNPNQKTKKSITATLLAYQKRPECLNMFLEAGAGSSTHVRWVLTDVLSLAIIRDDTDTIKMLIDKYGSLLKRCSTVWSRPLVQAAQLGKVEILNLLISRNADLNMPGKDGVTALHAAVEENHLHAVRTLLESGASINVTNNDDQTPLHIAALENRLSVIKELLIYNANPNKVDKTNNETPLMTSIRMRNEAAAKMIINESKLIDLDTVDNKGRTALMYALFFGTYTVVDLLFEKGADATIKDAQDKSALTMVLERLATDGSDKKLLRKYLKLCGSKHKRCLPYINGSNPFNSSLRGLRISYVSRFHKT